MPVVNFLACLNLEQNISFLVRLYLRLLNGQFLAVLRSVSADRYHPANESGQRKRG